MLTQANLHNMTLLVLCGGAGQRMGGQDKPLLEWQGKALVDHVLASVPEDMPKIISANRNLQQYASRASVVTDDEVVVDLQRNGPLVGILAGFKRCRTQWLLVTPGDSPKLPSLWWQHMASFTHNDVQAIVAFDGVRQQHLHLLLHVDLQQALNNYVFHGGYAVHQWLAQINAVQASFDNPDAFANFNYPDDLTNESTPS
jgi:molybdenum cofactor guanylyltransferase